MSPGPVPDLRHLDLMSDHRGLFEHAKGTERREEHGYCTDDNARLLVVASREPDLGAAHRLGRLALTFVLEAQDVDGQCRNRMDSSGRWTDRASTEDCWGRSLWATGSAATNHTNPTLRRLALRGFERGARQRSPHPRAMAFAALGAADVVAHDPRHVVARSLLADALATVGPIRSGAWAWPEDRLRYANAALAESVIAAGHALGRSADVDRGLAMLDWLLERELRRGHLSVTAVDGAGPDDRGPRFDQQPIEVAAMADACWRAGTLTGDSSWFRGVHAAERWFHGENDAGIVMFDESSGGGFDGLHHDRANLNQGAESTLAFVSTVQRARSLATTS
jgi:hypothetical protein